MSPIFVSAQTVSINNSRVEDVPESKIVG